MAADVQKIIEFSSEIEIIAHTNQITYLEAIMQHVEKTKLDLETVPKLMSPLLKQKLEREASELNLLQKEKKIDNMV